MTYGHLIRHLPFQLPLVLGYICFFLAQGFLRKGPSFALDAFALLNGISRPPVVLAKGECQRRGPEQKLRAP
jgi:hypothetical protein